MAKNGPSRLRTTVRDMILSMTLIVLPILAVIWLMPATHSASPVATVSSGDYQAMLTAARGSLPFSALSPTGLPAGWELTSDDYQPEGVTAADWHLGYQTPSGKYAAFEQTTLTVGQFLSSASSNAEKSGSVQVAGESWTEYTGTAPAAYKTLLFRRTADGKSLQIIAGSAPMAELQTLASSLKA
ncbi:DUF4245 domain-containing protein [Actinospica sp.]|uniref:DUF4245 domain-containing protein n=1 Tax=Actinospica sp. TaxID=1872142 RepID=UPI002C1029CD|nr:DUF4245 domain-containing protein [Actinospica sp.]HWG28845.1 DUF4245 domain-containing protein [Actinospica sp.]